ncbi:SIR2 family protein [Marinibaculum pumilum]|uniref:SIR2 family protein n=1 Tax=Marinibaculum pumilum TaxID=1766165 RepID=A0ABV7L9W2_9PROT
MPIEISDIKKIVNISRTVLLFGAGASVPSGAPTGAAMAGRLWEELAKTASQSDDLIETTSVLERLHGRKRVVEAIQKTLKPLQPTGGLLAIPEMNWSAIFSTNFDLLIEKSYKLAGKELSVIKSNFDLTNKEGRISTTLYKIHGCISEDRSLGNKSSMLLTESDYDEYRKYRQSIFSTIESMFLSNDIIIIGQSLRDRHLQDLVKKVLSFKDEGINSNVFLIVYERDDLRAPLLEDRGARLAFGGIDEFSHAFSSDIETQDGLLVLSGDEYRLPINVVSSVYDVIHKKSEDSNILRMFNGGAATYADIKANVTFERLRYRDILKKIDSSEVKIITITGAAGVGKTTFARQIALACQEKGALAWEHRNEFPFNSKVWLKIEEKLRKENIHGILILDECTRYLRQVNMLVEGLPPSDTSSLLIVATANSSQWVPRLKSPEIFTNGDLIELSKLEDSEISSLVNLYNHNREVQKLADRKFSNLSRRRQVGRLKDKCGADMFVCLKNIFAYENLDKIILNEYDELEEAPQEYYRYIAALEAIGAKVHRQMVMRMLSIGANQVSSVLDRLSGIVDEYEINPKYGIYGWSTRHVVIARKVTEYKFSGAEEMQDLFEKVVENINPAIPIELQSIRDLCDSEFGIGRISDTKIRQQLYRKLISAAPGERIPWHRLIRELLDFEGLEDTEYAIRDAMEAVGRDGPLDRYAVRLLLERAKRTEGIGDDDRLALVRRAYETAEGNINYHRNDKFSFTTLCDAAFAYANREGSAYIVDEAIAKLREASERLLDPELDKRLRKYEEMRARI